jgi:N4-gp56 family major capsid protein
MANDFQTGAFYSTTLPAGVRAYYEQLLLSTLRVNSIFVPFCITKEDFNARATSQIVYSEVFDTDPNWNALSESDLWLSGAHLDSRSITITVESHGDIMKFHDYVEVSNFFNNGDFRQLVGGKLGQNMIDYLDILAMNAHLTAPNVQYSDAAATSRFSLTAADLYDPDLGELAFTHLEELGIPGVMSVTDGGDVSVIGLTSPRVIHDIRKDTGWVDWKKYADPRIKLRHEAGAWGGVRYMKSNRLLLRNYGTVSNQTTLSADTVVGQGASASVDGFTVGQNTSTRYVTVVDSSGFSVGQYVTLHSQLVNDDDGAGGHAPSRSDGTQETRRITAIDSGGANRLSFDKPLLKPHTSGDYVTVGVTLSPIIVLGGPAVVYGVAERPNLVVPPKYDDLMRINRVGWRGYLKFQMFRPEWTEVIWTAVTTN